jgi:hypothetical protein
MHSHPYREPDTDQLKENARREGIEQAVRLLEYLGELTLSRKVRILLEVKPCSCGDYGDVIRATESVDKPILLPENFFKRLMNRSTK